MQHHIPPLTKLLATIALTIASAACVLAQTAPPPDAPASTAVQQHLAAQNKLFDAYFEQQLKKSPEFATHIGDYRYNNLLDDVSLASTERAFEAEKVFLVRLRLIPIQGMPPQDVLSHRLLERILEHDLEAHDLKTYEMPINQQGGIHTGLADLPLSMPFDTVRHYEDYIARLRAIPQALSQTEEVLRAGVKDGLTPPRYLLEKLPTQCEGVIAANPFLLPTRKFPASFTDADRKRLTGDINGAIHDAVFPAYRQFAAFLRTDYAPHGRTAISIESLPDGKRRYAFAVRTQTTTDYTPDQIHDIGLREVARITALETGIAHRQGFPDLPAFRASIAKDPRWIPTSAEQILDDFRADIAQMQPRLTDLFGVQPKSRVTVEAIPSFQSTTSTHYQTGTPDGSRPGRVSVATANFTHLSRVDDEATAYHEGIPGHHMQLSIQQQLTGLPRFRQFGGGGSTAFVEGWALYAEELGKEVGFYRDPVSDYGRLNSELFRAVRLVVDTGIHHKGWTRQQVVDYMLANDVVEPLAQSETDRYITRPGQALAYKLGQLKIRELREEAQQQLGSRFDIRTFHDEILNGGAMPLDLLQERVEQWIRQQLPQEAHR